MGADQARRGIDWNRTVSSFRNSSLFLRLTYCGTIFYDRIHPTQAVHFLNHPTLELLVYRNGE